jgi:phosphatidylethanolamine/phosphatidyl-N-methylethanolamine N-methyltransferase
MNDSLRFLARLITLPLHTGAIAPSSRGLARAMAAPIDAELKAPILELGPGTGVVTRAILERGIAPERVTAVEYNPHFAAMVTARYPGVRVIAGDAFDLETTLDGPKAGFAAVLSSLPLVNFPMELRERLIADVFANRLLPGAPYVQFSYRLSPPVAPPPGVRVTRSALVLANLPPARVWVYRQGR